MLLNFLSPLLPLNLYCRAYLCLLHFIIKINNNMFISSPDASEFNIILNKIYSKVLACVESNKIFNRRLFLLLNLSTEADFEFWAFYVKFQNDFYGEEEVISKEDLWLNDMRRIVTVLLINTKVRLLCLFNQSKFIFMSMYRNITN